MKDTVNDKQSYTSSQTTPGPSVIAPLWVYWEVVKLWGCDCSQTGMVSATLQSMIKELQATISGVCSKKVV